jgi:hypothetical protein
VSFWNRISTERKFELLQHQLDDLKRSFTNVLQEWDACQARVSKVLRRIARAEQARDHADEPEVVDGERSLPLTTLGASGDRLNKIREQLAAKGR